MEPDTQPGNGMQESERHRSGTVGLCGLIAAALLIGGAANADERIETLRETLPDKVQATLARMDGADRQLLALRSYLRGSRSLEKRWSWTQDEIDDYLKSDASRLAFEAVDLATRTFEEQNPGYSLHVNTKVRSLDVQIEHWNRNRSVAAGAVELGAAYAQWSADHEKASAAQIRAFLAGWKPTQPVSLAAPGLSPHGQARAFDFQIMQGGTIIAGTNTRIIDSVWDADGWTEKLKKAIKASGAPFRGPLEKPREPWHYDYYGGATPD